MEEQPGLDAPAPGRRDTSRVVALADLLHQDCKQLLELYVSIYHLFNGAQLF